MEDQRSAHGPVEKKQILSTGHEMTRQWINTLFPDYVDQLLHQLLQLAEKAGNNADMTRYCQAKDEVLANKDNLQQFFLNHISLAFDNYLHGKTTATDFTLDPLQQSDNKEEINENALSLVDNEELEEKLAVGTMSRKICADCSELIYATNQRLSALAGGRKINEQLNPVSPAVFAEGMQTAISDLTLDNRSKLLIYKVFEKQFMDKLYQLYEQLNIYYKDHGVLPNLSFGLKKNNDTAGINNPLQELPEELQAQLSQATIARQIELIHAIQVLQSQLRPRLVAQRPAGTPTVSIKQLLSSIHQLQQNAGVMLGNMNSQQSVASSNITNLRRQTEEAVKNSTEVDAQVIEIVGLMFEYMLNVQQLPDSIKALLSYLHTPFLKIALTDKDFFNHPDHPARQLLNSLVAAGERWVDPNAKDKNEVFQQIKVIVDRLLKDFDNDTRLLSELLFNFNQYLRQHSRRIRLTEKRALQAAEGENKLKEIRLKIKGYLEAKIGDIPLSSPISTLLFEPWANFLSFNLLRFGSRSQQWRKAAQIVDDILWYCQPHDVANDIHARTRIQELQQSLPKSLQAGFETVGYDSEQGNRLLKALENQQQSAPGDASVQPAIKPVKMDIEHVEINQNVQQVLSQNPILEKLSKLDIGTWFEFNSDTNEPEQVKLAWANRNTLHFMFVNRLGQQSNVKSGESLVAEMRAGKTRLLKKSDDKPFFEKAMENVLEQLQHQEQ